jgi:glucose-6-phosphate 1-epimerase
LPQHGFARNNRWEYLGKSTSESPPTPATKSTAPGGDGSVTLDFGLYSSGISADAKEAWPYEFGLVYSVTLGRDGLQTSLNVRNEGKETFDFQVLLHTYLHVAVSGAIDGGLLPRGDGYFWLRIYRTKFDSD